MNLNVNEKGMLVYCNIQFLIKLTTELYLTSISLTEFGFILQSHLLLLQ